MDRNRTAGVEDDEEYRVALRKESVDRNHPKAGKSQASRASLSARRAWIEMDFSGSAWVQEFRRSPQGERG